MHTMTLRVLAAAAALLAYSTPVLAQSSPSPSSLSSQPLEYPLSLDEAIALGLKNNLDVEIQRFAPLIAEEEADATWGAFDPTLSGDIGYDSLQQRSSNILVGDDRASDRQGGGGVRIDALLPYLGATVGVSLDGSRAKTKSAIQTLNPEYNAGLNFNAQVPLLRGLIWNEPWTQVKVRGIAFETSLQEFRADLMDTVRLIETSYWNLVATHEQLRVAQKSLETTQALLDQTRTQYEVGVVSRVEVVEAEAGVAERDFNVITADARYHTAQDQLIDLVLGRQLRAGTMLELVATDHPEDAAPRQISPEEAVKVAFSNRPELAAAQKAIEQRDVQLRFAKNQRLPEFNVEALYGFLGKTGERPGGLACGILGVSVSDCPPGSLIPVREESGSIGDSLGDMFGDDKGTAFQIRGVFSIPIPNTTARRNVSKAELERRRATTQRIRQEQAIILEVRDALRLLDAAARGIEAAERRRLAAEEQLRAERIRLEHGESTPFDVLQRERDLVDAESQKIEALQIYRTSIASLDRAQGTTLATRSIVIDNVRSVR